MHLTGLLDALSSTAMFQSLVERLKHQSRLPDQAIVRSARPFMVAAVVRALADIPILVVTARVDRAHNVAEQILAWLPDANVLRFQEPTTMFYEHAPWTDTTIQARIQTLAALAPPIRSRTAPEPPGTGSPVVISSAYALMQRTLPARQFRTASRHLRVGQQGDPEKLLQHWVAVGYQPASVVTGPGTFSRRGGIIDIYPPAMALPVRIEFFGDEIDSLRTFDPATQRSVAALDGFVVTPAREALPKNMSSLAERLATWFQSQPAPETDVTSTLDDYGHLESGMAFPHAEFYLPMLYQQPASLLDYLPQEALIIIEDWAALRDTVAELEVQALERREDLIPDNVIPPTMRLPYHTWDDLYESLTSRTPLHLGHPEHLIAPEEIEDDQLGFAPGPRFGGQLRLFMDHLEKLVPTADQAIVVTRQAQRLAELWSERHQQATYPLTKIDTLAELPPVTFVEGELTEGWVLEIDERSRLHLLTDAEIFGWKRPEPRRRTQQRRVNPEAYYADLEEGAYVVHVDYGIGRFQGVHKRRLQDSEREYLLVEYAGNDILYVPIHQADRLSRYVGVQSRPPTLNKLGNQDWNRTKKRTREAVQEAADELLDLYAARSVVQGHAFAPDTPWQHELEASFPYVETEDQLRGLREVKTDMESLQPMDRLICGDVGYGKTEIALRAAFKAVMDGKQVAVLVPTTVLAQQHYTTFSQRLVAFPIEIEMLSRFRTRAEQRQVIEDTQAGKIDILIGTHRLLQEDVRFKELGLLIIDEEQRFGVTHKERLKRMRTEVDVLTMTATPIPRTLYMGLTGLRDISLIQTPPEERLPIINHVGVHDERMIRQAILRELDRGGQVFFVHNRVQTIYAIADRLQRLVPEATFAVGHGQMDEHQLETIMADFALGAYDVLVCTTIIENGIDIPNANTMIVDRADRFGLAQLYQLRGRVGRSANQAYAYFFHPRNQPLTPEARARLETIGEYTELGSGMSIAVRDMEIRGMGDLLGVRQSGYIDAVGFHLYAQLLNEAVATIQNTRPELPQPKIGLTETDEDHSPRTPVTIDLPLPAYIPTDFIGDMALRIQLYRRLASIEDLEELDTMEAELQDRFGALPPAVQGLVYQMRVKLLGQLAGATGITTENSKVAIRLPYLGSINREALQEQLGDEVRISRTAVWLNASISDAQWQATLLSVLKNLDRREIGLVGMPSQLE